MQISDILSAEKTYNNIISNSKKRALEQSAHMLSLSLTYQTQDSEALAEDSTAEIASENETPTRVDEFDIFNALVEREQLGQTAIGNGVAIPHCAIPNINQASAVFIQLNEAIHFDAPDNIPVDIIIALAAPEAFSENFKPLLNRLVKILQDTAVLKKLRDCENSESLYHTLLSYEQLLLLNTEKTTLSV